MFALLKSFRGAAVVCTGLALLSAGCGTSSYNALMGRRLATLRGSARFQGLYAPTELPGTPLSIRVPIAFEHSYQASSAHDDDGAAINPDRLQPPFLKLPGFKICYEGMVDAGGTKLPFYCYLGAVTAQPGDADKLAAQLIGQLRQPLIREVGVQAEKQGEPKRASPKIPDDWQSIDADTPEGKSLRWRTLRVEGDQPFLTKTGDKVVPQNLPGIFELWIHDAENYIVIVAWRTPTSINGPSTTTATNPFERPANMKPDLATMPAMTAGTLTQASPSE